MANTDQLLGSAKGIRGNFNILIVILAFILSIMIIDTRNKCDSTDKKAYHDRVKISFFVAVIIVVGACLLFAYDLASIFGYIN